jgi:HSP20 family protein
MLPARWDPFKEIGTLQREIEDLFRRTFGSSREYAAEEPGMLAPVVNSFIKDGMFHLQAELPGVAKDDLEVSVDNNVLTIRGERKLQKEVKEKEFLIKESRYGSFARSMSLPAGVNTDNIRASYDNGILEINMPIEQKAGGRKVMIEGGESKEIPGKEVH